MIHSRSCSWCHTPNRIGPGLSNLCKHCGHRADVSRQECNCPACRPQTPTTEGIAANRLPFLPTQRDLAMALFYETALKAPGNGTLSEAEAQACLMLAAGKLYDACKAMLVAANYGPPATREAADQAARAIRAATYSEP